MIISAVINGVLVGGVYALVALGLTLIYGVLHVVNFAHGALLMVAMFAAWLIATRAGIDPYVALPALTAGMFALGWLLYVGLIGPVSRGEDQMLLLATLGLSIVLENGALALFSGNTQTIETPYSFAMIEVGSLLLSVTKLAAFGVSLALGGLLWAFMTFTETGRAIRAVAKEPEGARLVGIRPSRIFAFAFGLGTACLGAAACLLLPMYYVSPHVGGVFVLVAFTIVVLGGMGSFIGAVLGALIVGVAESLGGLFLGESLGPVLIPIVFVATLLLRPTGLFGRA
ncbi:branched-chain amino acid ABC transporter permease [Mesorhizobium australicum]|uniref:Amino acid/amide ABC transporter membrane protein 1, HAAT family n=1 Tax=Mesorhizobium australicum TaxID=536018 RepID=A0A1X7MSA6_9HYPH|nr:branched-chain amino acid ABC transporter permease [Mesorhizobium australicum]SMH27719.1 amino acid/amide ABC transporter membrane protein 1, HAAT family [Mesorhizobium australicum]